MNTDTPVRTIAGDGAYIAAVPYSKISRLPSGVRSIDSFATFELRTAEGAQCRPAPVMPATLHRSAWPSTLAAVAFALALDHGNTGCACLVALWWLCWRVDR